MHIKQVVISGFRSFRSQSEIEPFSPKHNVIVGRNGSGKSNFFDAIQFVLLNQRFSTLQQEARQVLLHEGAGANVMNAFVELIFDNSDGRLAQDGDEVVLRRTIGLKKDEFFLNRKRVTKQEVSSLLESAGFSKSNPYYIVQQGKVSTLTLMKDAERLNLLKEVAGTKVYEERRQESLKIMGESKDKRDKIQEVISYIEERLSELEEEKEELGAYQKHDRQRRALEYTLYDKELHKAKTSLEDKYSAMAESKIRMNDLHAELQESRAQTGDEEKKLADDENALAKLEKERAAKQAEKRELLGVRAKLELEVKDVSERVAADGDEQERLAEELKSLEKSIAAREKDLATEAGPAYEEARARVSATEAELAAATSQRDELYAKQSRGSKYRSADDRDRALTSQVRAIRASAAGKRGTADSLEQQARDAKKQLDLQKTRAADLEQELRQRHEHSQRVSAEIVQKTAIRNDLGEERKEKWRLLENLEKNIAEQQAALTKSEEQLRYAMPRHASAGLDAVERLVKEKRIEGYYGPVFDNFVLKDPMYAKAVEVAAGNSIFNVIVDNDVTAAKLMTLLERRKQGRVTFMPLNRLQRQDHPRNPVSREVVHLIDATVKFRPEVKAAMEQIFGKKLLAKDLDTASRLSDKANMDVVTMDGDEVNRKGAITGGYHDQRSARLLTLERVRQLDREVKDLIRQLDGMRPKVNEADQVVTNMLTELQRLEVRRTNERNVMAQSKKDLGHVKRAAVTTAEQLQEKEELLGQVRREAEQELARASMLEAEIGTPLTATLTDDDQRTLHDLNKNRVPALNSRLKTEFDALEVAAAARTRLVSILNGDLQKRREEVREMLDPDKGGIGGSTRSGEADERQEKLNQCQQELLKTERSLEGLRSALERSKTQTKQRGDELNALRKHVEDMKARETSLLEGLEEEAKVKERLLGKQTMHLAKVEENTKKIHDLGSLPPELDRYKNLTIKSLIERLAKVNENLKKYSHVNKKALEQYVGFSEQRETLLLRKTEIDKGQAAIKELIDALDLQKDEAILRTFRGVSQNFSDVFQELVPSGSGRMIIRTSADVAPRKNVGDDGEDEEGGEPGSGKKHKGKGKGKGKAVDGTPGADVAASEGGVEGEGEGEDGMSAAVSVSDFVGVQIKVSFAAAGETFLMSQLSGGQKAVVALALIFAIQRCDPAPFYLFDEIDQALDSSYRAAVASLIQRQAHSSENPTQFVITTFRPEMVAVANQCYGISHQNKVSNIHVLPKDEALGFVANIMNEEEAVGVELQQPATRTPAKSSRATEGGDESADEMDVEEGEGGGESMDEEEDDDDNDDDEEEEEGGGRRSSGGGKKRRVSGGGRRVSSR